MVTSGKTGEIALPRRALRQRRRPLALRPHANAGKAQGATEDLRHQTPARATANRLSARARSAALGKTPSRCYETRRLSSGGLSGPSPR